MLKIFQARLQKYVNRELPDVQAGFRKGRGTRDQIANICWIIEKAREFQKNIYFCFIDYDKAFDCVDHNKLCKIMRELSKGGTSTIYTVDQLLRANVLSNGAVVRCGLDNDGYISNIAIVAEYDENTETVVPTFGTPDTYASSYAPYSVSKSNLVVGTVETYDSKNSTVSVVCGEYEYLFTTDTNPSVKIYNTETGKIRTASVAEIRDGDSFVMRTLLYYKTTEMVIFR